ncbi:MAG: enoyl-CoA hydratase/isomerase family protein [Anaerolineae bacterium]|nr:enoyl-CoA hydratase/isomerase family protein [Anaerolineae bacterium]
MPNITTTLTNHILRVQLTRPQKKNALAPAMYDALREAIERADADLNIRVITITGSGDSFCAGNDLNSFLSDPGSDSAARFIRAIAAAKAPIVAAVNGVAVGVGLTMLLHCDLVYAAADAKFNFAFIDLGLLPEAGSTYLLPRMLGYGRAAELLMLGEAFDARKAQECGIVNAVVAADELEALAFAKAEQLAAKPPQALRQTKLLLRRGSALAVQEAMELELSMIGERLVSDEARGIMQAFFERRAASSRQ